MNVIRKLTDVSLGVYSQIVSVDLPEEEGLWLAAFGLSLGEPVCVLRRALFRGPLHIRTGSGAECALAESLASRLSVKEYSAPTSGEASLSGPPFPLPEFTEASHFSLLSPHGKSA